jgi:hypothetical protein
MAERKAGYQVVVYTKRLPESFIGPEILRNLLSKLSETSNTTIGNSWPGMPLDEANKIAESENMESYTDGYGKLRTARGVVVRVS